MDPQNQPTNPAANPAATPSTPAATTQAAPASDGNVIATPAGGDGQPGIGVIDLSQFFKENEPGVFDPDKVAALAKDRDAKAKSASYFQSQFMQKNEVPENIDGYAKDFKPDSAYEAIIDRPEVQDSIKQIREFGLKEGLSPRAVNAFIDFTLKQSIANNLIDMRTPEQIQADIQKATEAEKEKLTPFLESSRRTFEQQTEILNNFFNTPSVFTNDPEIKELLQSAASESAVAYKAIALMVDLIDAGGYKALPTQSQSVGVGAAEFWNKYNAEQDPVKREAMLAEFERTQPK